MVYEFRDLRSNNLINSYGSEEGARKLLQDAIERHGEVAVEHLMLIEDDPNSDYFRRIGIGSELLAYVRDAA
jgi:hypothetical protein